ncbi:MAG TPA: response regulator [Nitrososphaeraceae archaeon]
MTWLKQRIAVIDDEQDLVQLFAEAIKAHGYDARGFNDPLAAVEHLYLHHSDYSLVLTDVRMAGIDGFKLAQLVHQMNTKIKIICMSAFEMYDKELRETQMDEFVKKPIHITQLINVIRKHLVPEKIVS